MAHDRFTIDALKELIVARHDGAQGLRICLEFVRDARLQELLLSHLDECTPGPSRNCNRRFVSSGVIPTCLHASLLLRTGDGATYGQLLLVTRMELFSKSASVARAGRSRSTGTRWTIRCQASYERSCCARSRT